MATLLSNELPDTSENLG